MPRYAIYYAPPPTSPLWRFGSGTIGYDAETGTESASVPPSVEFREHWQAWTEEPRRYGFHATLKAPFELAAGTSEAGLVAAAECVAEGLAATRLPKLAVAALGRFVALVPDGPSSALSALAEACVHGFEPLRAPLSDDDRARRLRAPLTDRQIANLDRWGYPYVLSEFRFHMTLTGSLPVEARVPVRDALASAYRDVLPETGIAEIALFRQADRTSRFEILRRCRLGG